MVHFIEISIIIVVLTYIITTKGKHKERYKFKSEEKELIKKMKEVKENEDIKNNNKE